MMGQNQIGDVNVVVLKSVLPGSSLDAEFFPAWSRNGGSASCGLIPSS